MQAMIEWKLVCWAFMQKHIRPEAGVRKNKSLNNQLVAAVVGGARGHGK